MLWNDELTIALIEAYDARKSKKGSGSFKKDDWAEVAKTVNKTSANFKIPQVKVHWQHLMSNYRIVSSLVNRTGAGIPASTSSVALSDEFWEEMRVRDHKTYRWRNRSFNTLNRWTWLLEDKSQLTVTRSLRVRPEDLSYEEDTILADDDEDVSPEKTPQPIPRSGRRPAHEQIITAMNAVSERIISSEPAHQHPEVIERAMKLGVDDRIAALIMVLGKYPYFGLSLLTITDEKFIEIVNEDIRRLSKKLLEVFEV